MALLTDLRVTGYRNFDTFRSTGFTRLNLIVGANSVGKTNLLDALQYGCSGGDIETLVGGLRHRGELLAGVRSGDDRSLLDAAQLLRGRQLAHGTRLEVEAKFAGESDSEVSSAQVVLSGLHAPAVVFGSAPGSSPLGPTTPADGSSRSCTGRASIGRRFAPWLIESCHDARPCSSRHGR